MGVGEGVGLGVIDGIGLGVGEVGGAAVFVGGGVTSSARPFSGDGVGVSRLGRCSPGATQASKAIRNSTESRTCDDRLFI
jgi:hypothetical protein